MCLVKNNLLKNFKGNHLFRAGVSLGLIFVIFVLDLASKKRFFVIETPARTAITNLITFIQHKNTGLVFDLPFPQAVLIGITTAILLLVMIGLYFSIQSRHVSQTLALALILGGALGNLYDRWTLGYVRDWLLLFGRSAVNLADIAIATGIICYLLPKTQIVSQPKEHTDQRGQV